MDRLSTQAPAQGGAGIGSGSLLLIEDDLGDAVLVEELLREVGVVGAIDHRLSLAEATPALLQDDIACVLLDLHLPDATGFSGLQRVLELAPAVPVIVLTGLVDREAGNRALAFGAQDYLVKGSVDGELLLRAVRYARERKAAAARLAAAEVQRLTSARVLRGLLPRPLVLDTELRWALRYLPGGEQSELGGDFLDVVERPDGSLRIVIGDVCGHGPDEAALGASLRIAWRALVLGGKSDELMLPALQEVLVAERDTDIFTTVCDITLAADRRTAVLRLAGHPAPLVLGGAGQPELGPDQRGMPLGVIDEATWPQALVELPAGGALLCFTDGLIEGAVPGRRVLGEEGLEDFASSADLTDPEAALDLVVERVQEANGGPLADDLAALLLCL